MVVGNGLLAKRFREYENNEAYLIFASGVSDSKTANRNVFEREANLLSASLNTCGERMFIYFSTCSIGDPDLLSTPYVVHKLAMEQLIAESAHRYCIFRLSNVVGAYGNPNTVLNFLFNSIQTGRRIELWKNSERNLIDIDDVFLIVDYILRHGLFKNSIVNIARQENYPIPLVVETIERYLNKKGNYDILEKGTAFRIDTEPIVPILESLSLLREDLTLESLLAKYYPTNLDHCLSDESV